MDPSTPRPNRCRASEDRDVADHSGSTADPTLLRRDTNAFNTGCAEQFLVVHIFGPYALSQGATPNALWCADYKGEFQLGNQR